MLLDLFPLTLLASNADAGPVTPGDRSSGGGERAGQSIGRLVHATLLQSLGVLGMKIAAAATALTPSTSLFVEAAERIVEQALLPTLLTIEPGGEWDDQGTGGSGPLQPARENAALAMVILAPMMSVMSTADHVAGERGRWAERVIMKLRMLCGDEEQYVAAYCSEAVQRCTQRHQRTNDRRIVQW